MGLGGDELASPAPSQSMTANFICLLENSLGRGIWADPVASQLARPLDAILAYLPPEGARVHDCAFLFEIVWCVSARGCVAWSRMVDRFKRSWFLIQGTGWRGACLHGAAQSTTRSRRRLATFYTARQRCVVEETYASPSRRCLACFKYHDALPLSFKIVVVTHVKKKSFSTNLVGAFAPAPSTTSPITRLGKPTCLCLYPKGQNQQ